MAKLGFIGLGVMGSQMVNRLLEQGPHRDRLQPHARQSGMAGEKGMQWADSPRAVASASDFTFAMVTNAAAIAAITEGPDGIAGGLERGQNFYRHEHGESRR